MNKTPHVTAHWISPTILLRAAENDCDPRTVLFEAIAEQSEKSDKSNKSNKSNKSYKSNKSNKSDKTNRSDNSDETNDSDKSGEANEATSATTSESSEGWSNRLYAALIDLEAHEAANPGSGPRIDEAVRMLAHLVADISAGNFRVSYVTDMLRLLDYDDSIRLAREAGEVQGRNEAIRRQIKRDFGGDGLPTLSGSGTGVAQHRTPSIFDLAAQA